MQTIATVQAYDVMDQIHVSLQVRQQENHESDWETVLLTVTTFTSVGETEPLEWLRDCLVGLLETL